MRIDAHQHYWKLSRGDYEWLTPELSVLYKDYLPDNLTKELLQNGITKTIAVQAAPTVEETAYLLSLCEQNDTIAGVVGWLDFDSNTFQDLYASFRANPYFVGIRIMLQDIDADSYVFRPQVIANLQFLAEQQFPVDLLIKSHQFPTIIKMLELIPTLIAVIDHIGKPQITIQEKAQWEVSLAAVASYPNIYCKLSGMVTEADHSNWKEADFTDYIRHTLEVFGGKRVMFGSDWPVCLLAASYSEVLDIVNHNLPIELTDEEKEDIFGYNASRFYKLEIG